jgi:hypothetical protein
MSRKKTSRAELAKQLRKLNVDWVYAYYDGCGDSGQIETLEFKPVTPGALETEVKDLFYEVLADHYAGWELDEGSYGHFEWDVKEDTINLEHSTRTEMTEEQVL